MKFPNMFTPCFCSHGKNDNANNTESVVEETGLDRVKRMYKKSNVHNILGSLLTLLACLLGWIEKYRKKNYLLITFAAGDFGFISPELDYIINNSTLAFIISGTVGGIIHMNQAKDDYMRKNIATQYESEYLAKRHLIDKISLGALKGGIKYGLKYGSFSSLYMLLTMTAANYRDKVTVWDHIGSGALVGGLFRINYGLKGMAAAASAGAVLGGFAGGILVCSMWLMNVNFKEFRYWQSLTYLEGRSKMYEVTRDDLLKRD